MENEQLIEIASQLAHPSGEKGSEIAKMMDQTNSGMTKNAISNLNLIPGDSILELGHGNGGHLEFLLTQCENIHYTGLEISALMNQESQLINKLFINDKKADFVLYDGVNFPFSDNQFNKLFTVNTLYFWEKPRDFLTELSRIVKTNGLLSLTFAHRNFMETLPFTKFGFTLYNPDEVIKLIEKTNFRLKYEDVQLEIVLTKSGDPVERQFSTLVLENYK